MDFNRSSCWNSISEKVKPHIPTIDFDFSSSEEDDTIAIYERPAALSLKVPEDFDSFSEEDAELEELLKPVPQTCSDHQTVESSILASEADLEPGAGEDKSETLNNGVKLEASLKPNLDIAKSYEGCPVLSFARLDQWDLDDVLRNLKETKLSLQQHVTVAPAKTHAGSDINQSQENIMEQLAAFCKKQSESVKSPDCIRENKMSSRLVEKRTADLHLSHQERPAVYIYSRCPDPSVKPAKTSPNLSSEPEAPAQHNNNHQKNPPAKKDNLKVHTGSHMGGRGVTGKSMLLQKIRAMNRNVNKYPVKCTHRADLGVEANTEVESEHLWGDKQSDPEMESPQTDLESLVKEPKQHSGQQRWWFEKTFHREQAQKILRQLEEHRPTKSVDEKQPAAEMICALYEFEACHLESFNSPAAGTERKGSMLLKVNLSSPGVIGERGHGKRKHPAATRSHIYNTLVAWFLSLAGPEPRNCEDEVSAKVPFWVAGFQQLWTEDGLALHVLVVARHCYPARKRDKDIHAPFYSDVCRFLSETSLTVIARWLPELKNLLDQHPYTSPIHLPSSCLNCFISAISNQTVIERTFGLSPGLYWQTLETQDRVFKGKETTQELHTGVSVVLGSSGFFQHPLITHYTLQLVLDSGLDVCGLRLLYPPQEFLRERYGTPVYQKADEPCHPVVALAVRGPYAHSLLKDITTSLDSLLSKKANNTSSDHLRCRYQEPPFIHFPQLASQVHSELCLWFSGRLQGGSAQNHSGIVPSDDIVGSSPFKSSTSPSVLCATTKADFLLLVSPVVPPCCYGQVLAVCERRGFSFRGLQRLQLQSYGATLLGLTSYQTSVFCRPPASALDREELQLPCHCLVLLLRKENALRHSVSLPSALMREFKAQKLLGYIHSANDGVHTLEPSLCFHTVPYNNNLFKNFVKCMWAVPDPASVILSHHRCPSTPDMEQVVVLTLCGKDLTQGLSLLHKVLIAAEGDEQQAGFRLLCLKWLPALTRLQAQELSPYEVGDQLCYNSVETLMSSPALVCALRGFHVFSSLRKLLLHDSPQSLSVLMSPTPEVALRQTYLFFFEHEMIPDPQTVLTVCLFRPRVWNHSLAKIVHKLQQSGLTLVGLRVVTLDKSDATSLLPAESVHNLCSGPSLALCLQGENAVKRLLDMLSQEDSLMWMTCYGSGSYQQAVMDVRRLFPEGICCPETSTMRQEQILCLCSDPFASMEHKQSCTLTHVTQESLSVSTAKWRGSPVDVEIRLSSRQTTCLLIPLNARPRSQVPSQLEIVDQVLRSDCHLVAGRMSILDDEQRRHIARTLKVSSVREKKMAYFYLTPCLLMALQGENIVTGLSLILKRIYRERPDLEQVGKRIIYPESEKEATQLILYLFESLSSEGCDAIVQ